MGSFKGLVKGFNVEIFIGPFVDMCSALSGLTNLELLDLGDDRRMWGLTPPARAKPKLSYGVDLRRNPMYVVDRQGRVIRTIGARKDRGN